MRRVNVSRSVGTRVFALTAGICAAIALIAVGPSVATAQSTTERFAPADFAAIRYRAARDADVRSLAVRVSRWADADRAASFGRSLLAGARSNLPAGEFYQTDAVEVPIPEDALTPPAGARRWQTIIGVAGFTTEWLVLVAQRETLLWDFRVSSGKNVSLLDVAVALAAEVTGRELGDSLFALLPAAGDVPRGMVVQYTMSPSGAFDAQGSTIPPPTPRNPMKARPRAKLLATRPNRSRMKSSITGRRAPSPSSQSSVQAAIAKGRPLIAGFGERFVTTPIGGHGLVAAEAL